MPIFERISADLPVSLKTSNYSIVAADNGTEIQFQSASSTAASLPSVSAVENGFNFIVRNVGPGMLVIDPNNGDTIDGAASLNLGMGDWRWIRNDGTVWKSNATAGTIIGSQRIQMFELEIANNSGTLQHRFFGFGGGASTSPAFLDRINGATSTFTNTPTGTDSTTAFANGGKVSSANTNQFVFDVVNAQSDYNNLIATVNVSQTNLGGTYYVRCLSYIGNVNGVTKNRFSVGFTTAAGIGLNLNTTDIGTDRQIIVNFVGYLT